MSGDEGFYEAFVAPLEGRMARTAWRILRDPDRAADALQDALALVWRHRDRVRAHPNAEALVLRMVVHAAIDQLRKERRSRRAEEREALLGPRRAAPEGPDALLEGREVRGEVLEAIASLPGKQAAAVVLRVVEGLDYPEVASALQCSTVTARIHVMRGRSRLGRLLAHLAPRALRGGAS